MTAGAWLLALLAGCRCADPPAAPPPEPAPVATETPPAQLADLAIPEHPDLALGPLRPAPGPAGWWPAPSPGRWAAYRVWSSSRDRDWRAADVQLWHDVSTGGLLEREQLRSSGGALEAFSAQRLGAVGEGWGVVAARASGADGFEPLANAELWVAPQGTVFRSVWSGAPVTVQLLGVQAVTVPAGTFEALRVRRAWAVGARSTEEHAWWTAEHGLVALALRVQNGNEPDARLVLLAGEGTADREALAAVWDEQRAAAGVTR